MSIYPKPKFMPKQLPEQPVEEVGGAYRKRAHVWVDPPPGQGRGKICRVCGARMHVVGKDSACLGVDVPARAYATKHQYDPYDF